MSTCIRTSGRVDMADGYHPIIRLGDVGVDDDVVYLVTISGRRLSKAQVLQIAEMLRQMASGEAE